MVYVPPSQVAQATRFLSSPAAKAASTTTYVAQRGDTWSSLADRSNISVEALMHINKSSSSTLKPGQKITLPGRALASVNEPSQSRTHAPVSRATQPVVYANSSAPKKGAKDVEYLVQNGDTLYSIARRHNVDLETLMRANGVQSQREVYVGRLLMIPSPNVPQATAVQRADRNADKFNDSKKSSNSGKRSAHYIVRRGDTVASIAQQFAVSPQDIIGWNKLDKGQKLQPGNQIAILVD